MVIERETLLLENRGHTVLPFFVDTKTELEKSRIASGAKAIWNRAACRRVRTLISEFRPDIAHVHTPYPILSPAVFRTAHGAGIPTVLTLHSHRMICVNALFQRQGKVCEECVGRKLALPAIRHRCYHNSRLGSAVMAASLAVHHGIGTFQKCIDRYIALSPFAKSKLVATGFPEAKICVRPNFVPSEHLPGAGEAGNVLFVGRLVPEKGGQTLVRAWKQLERPPLLTIVGDGPLRAEIEAEAAGCNIEFTGWLTPEEVNQRMRRAALFVFPSEWYEAGPLVLIEAYSCGTPVLASDIGNFSDQVIEGKTGLKFRTGDVDDLAAKLRGLLSNPSQLAEMRRGAFDEYKVRYTAEASYTALMEIYQQAIEQRRLLK